MNALISIMTQKGQVTIPKQVQDKLHLVAGDKVEFIVNDRNEVVIKPITRKAMEVAGLLSKYKKAQPVSIEELNQLVGETFKDN